MVKQVDWPNRLTDYARNQRRPFPCLVDKLKGDLSSFFMRQKRQDEMWWKETTCVSKVVADAVTAVAKNKFVRNYLSVALSWRGFSGLSGLRSASSSPATS